MDNIKNLIIFERIDRYFSKIMDHELTRLKKLPGILVQEMKIDKDTAKSQVDLWLNENPMREYWMKNLYVLLTQAQTYKRVLITQGVELDSKFFQKLCKRIGSTEAAEERYKVGFLFEYMSEEWEAQHVNHEN